MWTPYNEALSRKKKCKLQFRKFKEYLKTYFFKLRIAVIQLFFIIRRSNLLKTFTTL